MKNVQQPASNILNEIALLRKDCLGQFSSLTERITLLEKNLLNKMNIIQKENDDLRRENCKLQARLTNVEQYQHNNSIDIVGFDVSDSELVPGVINMLNSCLGVQVEENDIDSIYKISNNPTNKLHGIINVKFVRKQIKDSIMRAKRGKKDLSTALLGFSPSNLIYVNHSMCAAKRKIFKEVWNLKKSKKVSSSLVQQWS